MGASVIQMILKLQPLLQPFLDPVNPMCMKIMSAAGFIGVFAAIPIIFIIAPIFSFLIIPRIEKKLGNKLEFPRGYNYFPFGNFIYPSFEISNYIVRNCFDIKLFPTRSEEALVKINYDVSQLSNFEVIMNIIAFLNWIIASIGIAVMILFGLVLLIIVFLYKQFGIDLIF